jgi:hypothetical protein
MGVQVWDLTYRGTPSVFRHGGPLVTQPLKLQRNQASLRTAAASITLIDPGVRRRPLVTQANTLLCVGFDVVIVLHRRFGLG